MSRTATGPSARWRLAAAELVIRLAHLTSSAAQAMARGCVAGATDLWIVTRDEVGHTAGLYNGDTRFPLMVQPLAAACTRGASHTGSRTRRRPHRP